MTRRSCRLAATLVSLSVVLAGCATDPADRSDMSLQEQYDQVAQRPDREQAIAAYEQLQEEVRAALQERFGLPDWEKGGSEPVTAPGCSEFPDLIGWDAATSNLHHWVAEDSITIDQWPHAQEILRELTREHGFDRVSLDIGQPDNLTYELTNDTGAKITLRSGSGSNVVLGGATGCHLKPGAKERGWPLSQEELREMDEEEREQYRE